MGVGQSKSVSGAKAKEVLRYIGVCIVTNHQARDKYHHATDSKS